MTLQEQIEKAFKKTMPQHELCEIISKQSEMLRVAKESLCLSKFNLEGIFNGLKYDSIKKEDISICLSATMICLHKSLATIEQMGKL